MEHGDAEQTPDNDSHPSDDGTSKSDIYNTAMTLMTERCSSTAARNRPSCGSAVSDKQSFGLQTPEYFYVEQTKPSPMTPLQAWRGYHGNVYFEPIKVQPARYSTPEQQEMPLEKCSDQLRDILKRSRRVQSSRSVPIAPVAGHEFVSIRPLARSMTNLGRNSARSNSSSQHRQAGYRKMAVLDKRMVFSENNENIHEDIIWIVGQESTGSLLLQNELAETEPNQPSNNRTASRLRHQRQQNAIKQRQPVAAQPKKGSLDRERICRGSVVRRSHPQRSGANRPGAPSVLFAVTGARLAQQQLQSSPLLRTQTQYSHSNQRCLNSPDLFSGLDRLPPLEQLRASLRHIEPDRRANPTHIIPPLDRIKFEDAESMTKDKPFVKYSVEVTNTARLRNGQISRRQQKVM
ncbi:hypothetical protein LSH36_2g00003 [Paralvinella palmiformis]|uniref:Uncharacterized protein n=1 Tax=Paralvinella palmiformis TaxID=53620 RepID=A0AAD9KFX8_9ANNE|nr:hypothetical protein LSH36_2g00003 [Paralvinella palmiformis]